MRQLRYAVMPLVLLAVLGVGLFGSHGAGAQEVRDDQYWIDRWVDEVGWSRQHASILVHVNSRTRWLVDRAMEALRTGDVQDFENPSIFRGPSLADLEAQLATMDTKIDRWIALNAAAYGHCVP